MDDVPATPRRSDVLEIVQTVMTTMNDLIAALRSEVAAMAENEKKREKRLTIYLAMIGVIVLASITGVTLTYRQGQNVKKVVTYINDCSNPKGKCKQSNDAQIAGVVKDISAKAFDSITCVLLTQPEKRSDATVQACRDKYLK